MKALITGASSGIGRDMARNLSKRGYDLILVARDENRLQELKKELEIYKVNIEIIAMDLAIEENCKELHKKVKDIDFLINNAGFGDCGDFTKTDLDKEIAMIHTNIIAYHILTKLYLIDMKKVNRGKILNVASIAGFMPGPLMSTYYATKSYVTSLTSAINEELREAKSRVHICMLCPGPVNTNFNNVANVTFALPGISATYCASYALRQMFRGKVTIVPTLMMKLGTTVAKCVPRQMVTAITARQQKKKIM